MKLNNIKAGQKGKKINKFKINDRSEAYLTVSLPMAPHFGWAFEKCFNSFLNTMNKGGNL